MREPLSKRLAFVGRSREQTIFLRTLTGYDRTVLLIEGNAGIGKTFLLEEAGRIAQNQAALCPPIIDFYDTGMHSHQRLEETIALSLDPDKKAFGEYWVQREKNPQMELWEPFLTGYMAATRDKRTVLRFDTAERLEYERDSQAVIDDCEVTELDAPSWEWLLKRISDLPNTTILVAARSTPTRLLRRRLLDAHKDRAFVLEVTGFTLEETDAYFRATEFGHLLANDFAETVERIHLLADGRPILIALALDWLERGRWDPHLYPVSVVELRRRKIEAQAEEDADQHGETWQQWHEIHQRFEEALVEQIRRLASPLYIAVRYAACCRKGCNTELLARLMEIGLEEAGELVAQLLTLSFVKPPRPDSRGKFFLHDEMYDMVERYVWLPEWPDYREQARLDQVISDWYTEQIGAYRGQIREAKEWQEQGRLRREQELLYAERLYYQFDADPRLGYREYSHLVEEAIAQREFEWDTWLRNEALWFTSHRAWRRGDPYDQAPDYPKRDPAWLQNGNTVRSPAVDHDCRRRWVSRHVARNQMSTATRIARRLLGRTPLLGEPELYRPGLQIALATAQAYLSGDYIVAAVEDFRAGIDALSTVPVEHREPWLHPYLLGSAHLYRGLALRGKLSLDQAREAYSKAILHFRQVEYRPGLAEATNNLAYILARQGRLEPALSACNEALRIRQELGDEYGIGLSLNTKGIIHERMARPITAIANSEQALEIFREIGNARGIMLAQINLGRSYRRKARSLEWGQENSDFETGEQYLMRVFEQQGPDTDRFYQVEAHNELGCLYRDWVATLHEKGERNGRIPKYLDLAEVNLGRAVELTADQDSQGMPHVVQHVDSLEDLARVHYWRAQLDIPCQEGDPVKVMTSQLDRAETLARQYIKGQEEIKLILGKVFFQFARLARLQRRSVVEMGKYYGLAAGYTENYSLDAPEAHKFAADACGWLGELNANEVEQAVGVMRDALRAENLRSTRLYDNVESVIKPLLGVGWPTTETEANHG